MNDTNGLRVVLYRATNTVNGHFYIGVTRKTVELRARGHYSHASGGSKTRFHNALRKYERSEIIWEPLAIFGTWQDALDAEVRAIAAFNPYYNTTIGGDAPGLGMPAKNRRKVLCLETGDVFDSVQAAARFAGVGVSTMSCVCHGRQYAARGLHFIYFAENLTEGQRLDLIAAKKQEKVRNLSWEISRPSERRVIELPPKNPKPGRAVVCVDDGKIYQSASEAARAYNACKSSIIELCLGKNGRKTTNGLVFAYHDGGL